MEHIQTMFNPRSVAVIGASGNLEKVGGRFLRNLILSGFEGNIYPVNNREKTVQGLCAFPSVEDIDGDIDLAAVVVPAKHVKSVVKELVKKGTRACIIITSGFSEVGRKKEEDRLVQIARSSGMRILGPNVFGLWSAKASMNATFGPSQIRPGNIAIVTQSGALGIAMIGKTIEEGIGLSTIVSVGNKSDINEVDLLTYLATDEHTRAVLLYIEGVKEGHEMVKVLLEKFPSKKPVIVLKSGRSELGKRAAASHTGSMAGSDRVFDAAVKQTGIFRANTLKQAFDWLRMFSRSPLPTANNCVIVTNGGGIGVMATDAAEPYKVPLYNDQEILKKTFSPVTPSFGSTKNPVDITGNALGHHYKAALQAAFDESSMGGIVALYCDTGMATAKELAQDFIHVHRANLGKKPVAYSLVGGEGVSNACEIMQENGLPVFDDVDDAVSAISVLYEKSRLLKRDDPLDKPPNFDDVRIAHTLDGARLEGRRWLLADEVRTVFEASAIPMARGGLARSVNEAVSLAESIGYPVVMKIASEDIVHKSDAGGVVLDLLSRQEVVDAYEAIIYNVARRYPGAKVRGVEVMEMARPGLEIIVGGSNDPSFGQIVMFGLGGIYVETLKDISFRLAPTALSEVRRMMAEIRTYPLLLGVRGESRKDIEAIADAIWKVSYLMDRHPSISELDINPFRVYSKGKGLTALDGRIMLKEE